MQGRYKVVALFTAITSVIFWPFESLFLLMAPMACDVPKNCEGAIGILYSILVFMPIVLVGLLVASFLLIRAKKYIFAFTLAFISLMPGLFLLFIMLRYVFVSLMGV